MITYPDTVTLPDLVLRFDAAAVRTGEERDAHTRVTLYNAEDEYLTDGWLNLSGREIEWTRSTWADDLEEADEASEALAIRVAEYVGY